MKNKSGALVVSQTIKLFLSILGVVLIIYTLFMIFAPSFNRNEKTAESYFQTLKDEIEKADKGEGGEFLIWENDNMYLVYFGKYKIVEYGDMNFILNNNYNNYVCVCYYDGEIKDGVCTYCKSLKYPAMLLGEDVTWAVKKGESVKISKSDDMYIFEK